MIEGSRQITFGVQPSRLVNRELAVILSPFAKETMNSHPIFYKASL